MRRVVRLGTWALCLGLSAPASTTGGGAEHGAALAADDDLAVVRRAVGEAAQASVPAPEPSTHAPRPRKGEPPQWLRARVLGKGREGGGKRIAINLPLALVRALDHVPLDLGCRQHPREPGRRCTSLRLADVLDALDRGESLVEIDHDDATIRVWVE